MGPDDWMMTGAMVFSLIMVTPFYMYIKYVIHGLNAFNGLQAVATFLVALLQCLPIKAN